MRDEHGDSPYRVTPDLNQERVKSFEQRGYTCIRLPEALQLGYSIEALRNAVQDPEKTILVSNEFGILTATPSGDARFRTWWRDDVPAIRSVTVDSEGCVVKIQDEVIGKNVSTIKY